MSTPRATHDHSFAARHRESRAAVNFAPPVLERLQETYDRPRRTYHASDHGEHNDQLCATCSALNLTTLFRDGIECEEGNGIRVRRRIPMGWSDKIYERAACPLCRLLVDLGDTRMSGDQREVEFWSITTIKGHEVISSITEPLFEVTSATDTGLDLVPPEAIYLVLVRTIKTPPNYGFEYRTLFRTIDFIGLLSAEHPCAPRCFSLRETGDAANTVKTIRGWIERCNGHDTCRTSRAVNLSFPHKFRLFDITSLQVVESNRQEPYLALSYPWAQMERFEAVEHGSSYALDALPQLLQDMISVIQSLDLGIHHIWMDRLCIDQEDQKQKKENIAAMGTIYAAAFATLILAVPSRDGPQEGLPGFSIARIPYQRVESVGGVKLATTLPSLEMTISTSQWNSRAWTFQEGLLSSRCIIFGAEQVFFECKEVACCESIQGLDLEVSEQDNLIPYKSRLRNPLSGPYDFDETYWRLVNDYTSRDLTLESDSLNAFSAFAAAFEENDHKLSWGMPTSRIVNHLLWEHIPFDFRDIQRRRDFPSWSWAGWSGTAAMNLPFDTFSKPDCICKVADEPLHGKVLSCYARTARVCISGQPSVYSIAGASISSVMMDRGMHIGQDSIPETCTLMEIFRQDGMTHGLLLERRGETYERIGAGFATFSDPEAAPTEWQELKLS